MRFLVLGELCADVHGRTVQVGRGLESRLLAALLVDRGRTVTGDALVDRLWGEAVPATAVNEVQVYVRRLRRRLESSGEVASQSVVVTRPSGYAVDLTSCTVDAADFERLTARADSALAGAPQTALELAEEALALWRGDPWGREGSLPWLAGDGQRLKELRRHAEETRAEALLAIGRHAASVADLERAVAAEPFREQRWAQLIRALYRSGRQADALAAYGRLERMLATELGVEPGPELRGLHRTVLTQSPEATQRAAATDAPTLLGRDTLVAQVLKRCAGPGVVTLLGPGGVGKTAVAEEVLASTGQVRRARTDLSGVSDEREVLDRVAFALGVVGPDAGGDLGRSVALSLSASEVLLVLDGCETAVAALSTLLAEWARAAPGLTVLCTSRRALRAPGETLVHVPGLQPDAAARLFTGRFGASADPGVVREICRRLEGSPLAILLAASWGGVLTGTEVLTRIDDGLAASPRQRTLLPDRHRTVAATLAWSHGLLGPDAQIVLRRLAVFEGPAARPFVDAVTCGGDLSVSAVDEALSELREAAMVTVGHAGTQTIVELRGPVRAYAMARLGGSGETDATMDRLVDTVLSTMADCAEGASGTLQVKALGAMEEALPVVRPVLRTLAESRDSRLVGLCRSMSALWLARGQWVEARRWFTAAVPIASTAPERAMALNGFVTSHGTLGGIASRGSEARQALELAREARDPAVLVEALTAFGVWAGWNRDLATATAALDEACDVARAAGHPAAEARARSMRALATAVAGEVPRARMIQRRCARQLLELGDRVGAARTLLYAGHVGRLVGDEAGAEADFRRSAEVAGEVGAVSLFTHARFGRGQVGLVRGGDDARPLLEQAGEAFERLGDERCTALARYSLARLNPDATERVAGLRSTLDPLARTDEVGLALPLAELAMSYLQAGRGAEAGLLVGFATRPMATPGLPLAQADRQFLAKCGSMLEARLGAEPARQLQTAGARLTTDDVVSLGQGEVSASDIVGAAPEPR